MQWISKWKMVQTVHLTRCIKSIISNGTLQINWTCRPQAIKIGGGYTSTVYLFLTPLLRESERWFGAQIMDYIRTTGINIARDLEKFVNSPKYDDDISVVPIGGDEEFHLRPSMENTTAASP